jgi:hypothetical protein
MDGLAAAATAAGDPALAAQARAALAEKREGKGGGAPFAVPGAARSKP